MEILWTVLAILAAAAVLTLLIAYICYRMAFYAPRKKKKNSEEFSLPPGDDYAPYRDQMIAWMKETRALPHEKMQIRSFDGLTLCGKYYEYTPGAVIELMMPGYRGEAERDLCGGVQRCFAIGRSALIVDQRACGNSEGNVITFGVNEYKDCLAWVDHMIGHFGSDVKIILTGISMGAATVLITSGQDLPKNVIGVIADCGFTSARDIIKKVIRDMKLPADLAYPFVKLGARIFGHFDLEEVTPMDAVKHCRIPVFFAHGEADDYVPCEMTRRNYECCKAPKKLLTVPKAAHGVSYIVAPDDYIRVLQETMSYDQGAKL